MGKRPVFDGRNPTFFNEYQKLKDSLEMDTEGRIRGAELSIISQEILPKVFLCTMGNVGHGQGSA